MTGEPVTLFKGLSDLVASLWTRGAILLWCLAAACLVTIFALLVCARWQLGDASSLLKNYGAELVIATLVLIVFASFKTYAERPRPILALIPTTEQSFWCRAAQPDGKIYTQLALRFQATNLSDSAIKLSTVKFVRPKVRRSAIITALLHVQHPTRNEYSSENPILPHSLTHASSIIIVGYPLGRIGKPMRIVVCLQDHAGLWHKLLFPYVAMVGPGA